MNQFMIILMRVSLGFVNVCAYACACTVGVCMCMCICVANKGKRAESHRPLAVWSSQWRFDRDVLLLDDLSFRVAVVLL